MKHTDIKIEVTKMDEKEINSIEDLDNYIKERCFKETDMFCNEATLSKIESIVTHELNRAIDKGLIKPFDYEVDYNKFTGTLRIDRK